MFDKYLILIKVAAGVLILVGTFFFGTHYQANEDKVEQDKIRVEMQAKIDVETARREEVSTNFETKLSNLKIINTTVNKTVQKEVQKQIYTDCRFPDTGAALITDNATKLNASRKVDNASK